MVPSKENPEYSTAPTTMPMNREEYTSLVMRARPMATTGGSRDQKVAYRPGTSCAAASSAKAGTANRKAKARTATAAVRSCFLRSIVRETPFQNNAGHAVRFLFMRTCVRTKQKPCPCGHKGRLNGLTLCVCGDLKFGRTVHSLVRAMMRYQDCLLYTSRCV